ncbi:hypothetical protein [Bordetella bronchiseptica]|uniref:hypothetical protein n=1 Tax=Bordetella bronchiseptica TaxID=518 RepID=UPI0002D633EE|nr:hypothetical protein [Bordetella bronchiseptica]KDC13316.1 toxin-antitoxin system, toxin component, HipA family [Bordetella bronchiseptica E014]KDC64494.1 toxin-antitoxin system, toxin component, HipA family [Bordetella bronchiseptica MBORD591]KDC97443.1 toxin-antitoxin system, toxin component, HipA family [Bordetella bronchiseptica MBORD675]KDE01286.1 toxin-antitoxin system, toxin component, HipA family [Bordetella bronchiseptica SBL-F6116]
MKLNVFIHGTRVALLDSPDGFQHRLAYLPETDPARFALLTMPARDEGLPPPARAAHFAAQRIGESPLLAPRRRRQPARPPS